MYTLTLYRYTMGTRRLEVPAIASIALPDSIDAATASEIRHRINYALNALFDAQMLTVHIKATLD